MAVRATLGFDKEPEKRSAPRKTLRLLVSGRRGEEQASVLIHDLSENGMLIESASPLETDETIDVELPGKGSCKAVVVWSSSRFRVPLRRSALFRCDQRRPAQGSPRSAMTRSPSLTRQKLYRGGSLPA